MATIVKRRDIINLHGLLEDYRSQWSEEEQISTSRQRLLEMSKNVLAAGRQEIRRRFEKDKASGEANVSSNSFLVDQLLHFALQIITQHMYSTAEPTSAERICLVGTGGYGRGELAPFSDVDLMFLLPYRITPRVEQIIESTLYLLWDLGLKVGHATRNVDEVLRLSEEDITIRTAILESRFLWGNRKLFSDMRRVFRKKIISESGPAFVEAKLMERDKRHERMGDSRYVLEPNVKEGKGGLRDLHTLFWIAKYLYQVESISDLVEKGVLTSGEAIRFAKAQNFLWTVRSNLHYISGRGEERLTLDIQQEIGRRMGYKDHAGTLGVERFMKHYYLIAKQVGDLTRIFCSALEAEHKSWGGFRFRARDLFRRDIDGFKIESGRLSLSSGKQLADDPVQILKLFRTAQIHKRDIHPRALRLITRHLKYVDTIRENKDANRIFLDILVDKRDAEITLRRLNEAGVFGRFIPDFGRVVAQMQYDMYHVYTVDEHTIFAIGVLHAIEQGKYIEDMPVASEAIKNLVSKRALYVAILLHDIAKGRGGDHSILGAEIAEYLCPRLGLSQEETETVGWLVRHHLLMSRIAFHRDLSDNKSILDFVEQVQSVERLRLLLCLTVADIRAVGPSVWNNWKASLLRELYCAAEARLSGGHESTGVQVRVQTARQELNSSLLANGWKAEDVEEILALGYQSYWLSFDTAIHKRHAVLILKALNESNLVAFDVRSDPQHAVTELTIYTPDHPGLFSSIAGAIAVCGANIVGAKIFTMTNGMALDVFTIQSINGSAMTEQTDLDRLTQRIESALRGEWKPELELKNKFAILKSEKVFSISPRVLINNAASRTHSVVEVNACDRPAFLHDVTQALANLGLQISSALISTYGERAVDVFYVKDAFGMQVTNERKLEQIKKKLHEIVSSGTLDSANVSSVNRELMVNDLREDHSTWALN
jgi:[protein-PII] uridylyltransferase